MAERQVCACILRVVTRRAARNDVLSGHADLDAHPIDVALVPVLVRRLEGDAAADDTVEDQGEHRGLGLRRGL
jgi:hypothetical protein